MAAMLGQLTQVPIFFLKAGTCFYRSPFAELLIYLFICLNDIIQIKER